MNSGPMSTAALVDENLQLAGAVRSGAGPACTKPWISLEERSSLGTVKPCCWYRGQPLGRIRDENDLDGIWSGKNYRLLRRRMTAGIPEECPVWCPVLGARQVWFEKQELYDYTREELASFDADFLANRARVLRAILAGDSDMRGTWPLRLHLHPSDVCNLRCIMCYLDLESGRTRDWYGGDRLATAMRYLEEIKVFGGEPFFCDTSRALILSADKPRWTHTSFLTNGMLVTPRVIEALEAVRIGSVDVSLDAAGDATYERVRLRGSFAKALAGARRLVELSGRHRLRRFPVYADFVIQERNYREVEEFVSLCDDTGLIPNFSDVGVTKEAENRARQQGTELGAAPLDRSDLLRRLDGAIGRADSLGFEFALASLQRIRTETLRTR